MQRTRTITVLSAGLLLSSAARGDSPAPPQPWTPVAEGPLLWAPAPGPATPPAAPAPAAPPKVEVAPLPPILPPAPEFRAAPVAVSEIPPRPPAELRPRPGPLDLTIPPVPAPASPAPRPAEPPKPKPPAPLQPPTAPTPLAPPRPLPTPAAAPSMSPAADPMWCGVVGGAVAPASATSPAMAGIPGGKHGVYGSPNLTLSRDYRFADLFGVGLWGEDSETRVLGNAPGDGKYAASRASVEADYLLWWVNPGRTPVLATGGAGEALLGPGGFGSSARNGFRVRAGYGGDDDPGVAGSFFFLGRQTTTAALDSVQYPSLSRPTFDPTGAAPLRPVAVPGLSTGSVALENRSTLWGGELSVKSSLYRGCDSFSEVFAGYRHLNLRETLGVSDVSRALAGASDPAGTSVASLDTLTARSRFHGGQVGYAFGRQSGRLVWGGRASVALGVTDQSLSLGGAQARTLPGGTPTLSSGGLFAPATGTDLSRDRFGVVPEVGLSVGYRVAPGLTASVGYNFLYWTNVIRPGDQLGRTGPGLKSSDLAVQGVTLGLEYRW